MIPVLIGAAAILTVAALSDDDDNDEQSTDKLRGVKLRPLEPGI